MSQSKTAILVLLVAFYLPTFALYDFLVFRVNKHLAPNRRIRHSTSFLSWSKLGESYREFYPEIFFTRSRDPLRLSYFHCRWNSCAASLGIWLGEITLRKSYPSRCP